MSKEKQIEEKDKRAYDCDECEHFRVCYKIHQYHVQQINTGLYCPSFKRKQSEVLDDLEDLLIDFDEMGFCPRTTVPDPEGYAVEWKRKLVNALQGYRKQSEGEWEIVKGSNGKEKMVCTNCRHQQDLASTFTYCPNCGARMKGV